MTTMDVAQRARGTIEQVLQGRKLEAPSRWLLVESERTWLIGVLPQLPSLSAYISSDLVHSLSTALQGRPVIISNHTGLRYAVLLSEKPSLPRNCVFPEDFQAKDIFPLGIGYRGAVHLAAPVWQHMMIAGAPGSGKSNLEKLIALTAKRQGWKLYLADPDGHTFNPDARNSITAAPVAQSPEDLLKLTELIIADICARAVAFRAEARGGRTPDDLEEYNRVAAHPLPRLALIVDEANSYLSDKDILKGLADIGRRGRKWGVHLVLAAHNWRAADVPRELSVMLHTRVCLRVDDNTSGDVVLGSRIWGRAAMTIKAPGRAIVSVNGRVEPIQLYEMTRETEDRLMAGASVPDPLGPFDQALVKYAVERAGGQFKIKELAAACKEQGATEWTVRKLAESWELRGWLTHPANATAARMVTPELARLAGFDLTGAQAAQGITGTTQASQGEESPSQEQK